MKKISKILSVCLIVSLVFVVLQSTVLATDLDLSDILGTGEDIQDIENTADENTNNTNTSEDNSAKNNTLTNVSSSADEKLPKTGITEDYAIIAFVVVCGISAVVAYKKVKKYNI